MRKLFTLILIACAASLAIGQSITVGSKKFTESYVLGEIAKKVLADSGYAVDHKQGMGGTIILWQALTSGGIDLYPEYTGTINEEILKRTGITDEEMRAALKEKGIGVGPELGFDDTYALVMTEKRAAELGISSISDLAKHPDLIAGVTPEFFGRKDGWAPLTQRYGLKFADVKTIEHTLGYEALRHGQTDVKEAYSTDAKIAEYGLRLLKDDLQFFPKYRAVFLYRLETPQKAVDALAKLGGTIDEAKMTALNASAERSNDYAAAAAEYFRERGEAVQVEKPSLASNLGRWLNEHLILVGVSLLLAVIVGIPLGIAAAGSRALGALILGATGVLQTIPSLALLALLVPLLGIEPTTAIVALFLYSLLPIVRNTATGLQDIPPSLRESAAALGLSNSARLRKVYLPMASRSILAGIKTSAVINVGTATLAALIGAGGLGTPIISGLNLNDKEVILQGAIPAAALALLVQFLFDALDHAVIPRGLRLKGETR